MAAILAQVGYNDRAKITGKKTGLAISVFGDARRKGDMAGGTTLSPDEIFA